MAQQPSEEAGFADDGITRTYRRLRFLASAALIFLPLLTAAAGSLGGHPFQYSLSDYYFAARDGGLPRTLFVVFLAFLGGVLLSCRGLDDRDNRIHNTAGLFSLGVAFFPMACDVQAHPYCVPGLLPKLHLPSAVLLYASAMLSVWYTGGPKLAEAYERLASSNHWRARLQSIRRWSMSLMTFGILAFVVHRLAPRFLDGFSFIFWIEYLGFLGFGVYWLRLLRFVDDLNKQGRREFPQPTVAPAPPGVADAARPFKPGPAEPPWRDVP